MLNKDGIDRLCERVTVGGGGMFDAVVVVFVCLHVLAIRIRHLNRNSQQISCLLIEDPVRFGISAQARRIENHLVDADRGSVSIHSRKANALAQCGYVHRP